MSVWMLTTHNAFVEPKHNSEPRTDKVYSQQCKRAPEAASLTDTILYFVALCTYCSHSPYLTSISSVHSPYVVCRLHMKLLAEAERQRTRISEGPSWVLLWL